MYLSNFKTFSPAHILPQKQLLDWIAKAHQTVLTQNHLPSGANILEKLFAIGLGDKKIESRGTCLLDCTHEDFSVMQVYDLSVSPQGKGFSAKMVAFEKAADEAFQIFYPPESPLPDHLIHATCTGYISPSSAQKIVSQRGAGDVCVVTHVYHMGCYAAFPALRIAQGFSQSGCVDIVHTELCTLHMDPSTHTYEQLVIQTLFADGFIKYQASLSPSPSSLKVLALHEIIVPETETEMRWECSDFGLKMSLSKNIPVRIRQHLPAFMEHLLEKADLNLSAIAHCVMAIHPGGTKIIEHIADLFELKEEQYSHSLQIFQSRGNMSSATLPHIWQAILQDPNIKPQTIIISCAFGPGLTISGSIAIKEG